MYIKMRNVHVKFVCINNLILLYAYCKVIVHTKLCVFCVLEPYRYCGDSFLHFFLFQIRYYEQLIMRFWWKVLQI